MRIWKEEGNGDEAFKLSKIIVTHHKPIVCVAASSLLDIAVSASLENWSCETGELPKIENWKPEQAQPEM